MDLPSKNEPILNMISANLNPCGCTPLMLACAFDSDGYVVRELILNAHARADLTDKYGYNALHYAAFQGNINVFEIVIKNFLYLCNFEIFFLKLA
jgi:ankyrin repeat protein